jgi:hypothetical protein
VNDGAAPGYRDWRKTGSFAHLSADEVRARKRRAVQAFRRTGRGFMLVPMVVHDGLSPEHLAALERLKETDGAYVVTWAQWTQGGNYLAGWRSRRTDLGA